MPLIKLSANLTTTLMLNNKGSEPILASPRFYSLAGTRLNIAPIIVPAASYIDVDMTQLLAEAGPEYREGSLKIIYQGGDYQLGAQVKMVNEQSGLIWAEQLVYTSKFISNRLESVWWLPHEEAETRLVVSNTSYSPVTVTLLAEGTSPQQSSPVHITLNRSETRVLDILSDIVGVPNGDLDTKGGISISHTGNPGAVLARIFVGKADQGYSSAIPFVDPENTASSKWHGNGLRLRNLDGSKLKPILVARNTTNQMTSLRGRIPYTRPDGEMGHINLPDSPLPANTARFIDLQGRIASAGLPASVSYAGIELEYDALPGTVIIQLQSISQNGEHVFQVPIFDPQKTPTSAGGYPWKADGDYHTILYLKNETDQPKKYTAFMNWEGGGYSLGVNEIKRNQTLAIDFRELRDSQTPDVNGNVIPYYVNKGQIAWSITGSTDNELSGRSEQISASGRISNTYDCRNHCLNVFYDGGIDPFDLFSSVGEFANFSAFQQDVNDYGQVLPPYPVDASWDSSAVNVAEIDAYGLAESIAPGTTMIGATWQAQRRFGEVGGFECVYEAITVFRDAPVEVVQPSVASISASIASTKNPNVTATPVPGTFSTQNASTSFPTESTTDMLVVFQGSDTISIAAQGVNPPNSANSLKWKLDRNTTDAITSGTPSLSTQTGAQLNLTPSAAGSFRLIAYFDANGNGGYDEGEEAKILLIAIVRTSITASNCTIDSPMVSFEGGPDPGQPGIFGVTSGSLPMSMNCEFLVEGGGSNKRIGTNKVKFGNIGNLTADSARVNYATGNATENPGGPLPMIDTANVKTGNPPTGGATAFRGNSLDNSSNAGSGGMEWVVTSSDVPNFGPVKIAHQVNNTLWANTQGGYDYTEYIAGYSFTFPKTYVVVAKATWTIRFTGTRNTNGTWANNNSGVTLQGNSQQSANFTVTVSSGSPQSGNAAGIQVLGLSYVNQHSFIYSQ